MQYICLQWSTILSFTSTAKQLHMNILTQQLKNFRNCADLIIANLNENTELQLQCRLLNVKVLLLL